MKQAIQFENNIRILYVIKLEDGYYYIGQSNKKNYEGRVSAHFRGKGSNWTKLHQPIEVIETHEFTGDYRYGEHLENEKTVEYMRKYGMENVRGGFFSQVSSVGLKKNLARHGFKDID